MEAPTSVIPEASLFDQGGPVMYPLAIAAVIGVTFIIHCILTLRRRAVMSPPLVLVADNLRDPNEFDDALAICKREGGPFAAILASVIATYDLARAEAEAIVEGAGRRAMHDLSRGTFALEVVSGISTMLGLLGTVSGMFNMMMTISHSGVKDIAAISGGIGEALITTIAGLAIAIPAYIAYVYFSRRVEDVVLNMEESAIHLMARIRNDSENQPHAKSEKLPTVPPPLAPKFNPLAAPAPAVSGMLKAAATTPPMQVRKTVSERMNQAQAALGKPVRGDPAGAAAAAAQEAGQ